MEYANALNGCEELTVHPHKLPDQLFVAIKAFVYDLEIVTGRKFGSPEDKLEVGVPLLLSVRSGGSCPVHQHSKTILNLGMNDAVVSKLSAETSEYFALDCYRRFLQMFGTTVGQIQTFCYDDIMSKLLIDKGGVAPMDIKDLRAIVKAFKEISLVPEDPWDQLQAAVASYYRIWFSKGCKRDREFHQIPEDAGVSIIVQSMVFGNLTHGSGTGICSTRHPTTGEKVLFGEFLPTSEGSVCFLLWIVNNILFTMSFPQGMSWFLLSDHQLLWKRCKLRSVMFTKDSLGMPQR